MIVSLVFVRIVDVIGCFETLQDVFDNDKDLLFMLDYFEDNYIGRLRQNGRHDPTFPLPLWNCHQMVIDRLPRTNNNIEVFIFCAELALTHQPPMPFVPMIPREKFLNTTDPVDLCAVRCTESVQTAADAKRFSLRMYRMSPNSTSAETMFNKEKLAKICNDTSTAIQCVNRCPDRPWKSRISVLLDPLIYACSGSNLLDHVDCFQNVYPQNKDRCIESRQCQERRNQVANTAYQTMMSLVTMPTVQSNSLASNLMKHVCDVDFLQPFSDLLDHVDCFQNVYPQNKDRCIELRQCQERRNQVANTAYQTMMSLVTMPTVQSNSLASNLMKHVCDYVECASDCTKSEIIAQCGREAYSELSLFFRRTMTSIKLLMSLYMSAITNSELKFDDTCDRLGAV
uniref:Uncharacterized protein n=1 Tax=Romanomermis culicivorax TaxID=13658 RepID=A0A915JD42_ROMCU